MIRDFLPHIYQVAQKGVLVTDSHLLFTGQPSSDSVSKENYRIETRTEPKVLSVYLELNSPTGMKNTLLERVGLAFLLICCWFCPHAALR